MCEDNELLSRPFLTKERVKQHILGIKVFKLADRDHLHPVKYQKTRREKVVPEIKKGRWRAGSHRCLGLGSVGVLQRLVEEPTLIGISISDLKANIILLLVQSVSDTKI